MLSCFTFCLSELDATSKSHKTSFRKKKIRKHSDKAPEPTGSAAPPPLRKSMSKSQEEDRNDNIPQSEMKLEKKSLKGVTKRHNLLWNRSPRGCKVACI